MKILFTRFPLESAHGGAEKQTLSLMKGLSEKNHAVAFLGSCPVLLDGASELHLPHAKLDIGPPPVTKTGVISFVWRKQEMKRRLEAALAGFSNLDAIVMLSLSEKLLLTPIAIQRGIKVFWLEHDRVGRWLTKNPWLPQLKKLSRSVKTICVSELSRKIYLELGWRPEDVVAIPNGIPPPPTPPPASAAQPQGEGCSSPSPGRQPGGGGRGVGVQLGCVARLSHEKGVDVLISSMADISDVSLTIVGTGPEEASLRAAIQPYNHITILARVDNLAAFYHSIDVLVLPSRDNDPFGLVAAEAMSLGIPVIVTDQCGVAGYLRHDVDALIVPAESSLALAEAIRRMEDPDLRERIGKAGEKTAESEFSVEKMVERYDQLLRS